MSSRASNGIKKIVFICLIIVQIPAFSDTKSDKAKQRLEQLFLWKVSDRLQLSPKEENQMATEFKKIADEKSKLAVQAEELWAKIEKSKTDKNKSAQLLKEHLSIQSKLHNLQLKEVQTVEKLFGSQRASEYVLVKRELMQKIRDLLTERSHASTTN